MSLNTLPQFTISKVVKIVESSSSTKGNKLDWIQILVEFIHNYQSKQSLQLLCFAHFNLKQVILSKQCYEQEVLLPNIVQFWGELRKCKKDSKWSSCVLVKVSTSLMWNSVLFLYVSLLHQ